MGIPVFALSPGDNEIRRYSVGNSSLVVMPSRVGAATILDKDIWIYATSQLVAAIEAGKDVSTTVRIRVASFLDVTGRKKGGKTLGDVEESLRRLAGTRILTNIRTNKREESENFGLIDGYRIVSRGSRGRFDPRIIDITLPKWLYQAILAREVLTLDPEYFRLRPLERRLYEVGRKHCGQQPRWAINLDSLHAKTGSRAELKRFRFQIKKIVRESSIPGYGLTYDATQDLVVFESTNPNPRPRNTAPRVPLPVLRAGKPPGPSPALLAELLPEMEAARNAQAKKHLDEIRTTLGLRPAREPESSLH